MNNSILSKIGRIHNTSVCNTEDVIQRCIVTLREMLQDRLYANIQGCFTYSSALNAMQEGQRVLYACDSPRHKDVDVFFHSEEKVGVKQLRSWCETSLASKLIIVSLDGPTSFTKKEAEQDERDLQFFTFKELCANISRHVLVPKHEYVSDEEAQKHNELLNKDELPKLFSNDKICLYYAFSIGDIIRITRMIAYNEPVVYYRVVCAPNVV